MLARPRAHKLRHLDVTRPAIVQSLGEHVVHLLVQGVDEADRRRGGRLIALVILEHVYEIEVVAPVRNLARPRERALADGSNGEARRQRETLLRAGKGHVHAPGVELDLGASHRGDGIHQHQHVGILLAHHRRDLLNGIHHAGRGFVEGEGQHVVVAFAQRRIDHLRREAVPHLDLQAVDRHAVPLRHLEPTLGERAADCD